MTDQELTLKALNDAAEIIAAYLEPGHPRNAEATLDRLIVLLGNQQLAEAVDRLEAGFGLRVVK